MPEDIKLYEKVAALDAEFKSEMKNLRENHLAHIYAALLKLDSRTWWTLGTIVIGTLLSIATSLIILIIK